MQYIHVKVLTGVKKESFVKKTKDSFAISVKEKAQRNKANARVLEFVAEHFKVPINNVRIINGHHHTSKLLIVEKN